MDECQAPSFDDSRHQRDQGLASGSKQVVYQSLDAPTLEAAMTATYPAAQANLESQDYIEGPKAFAERRKPEWQNR